MGLDGATTIVRIEQGSNRVEYSWWEDLPKQWSGLQNVLARIYAGQPDWVTRGTSRE